MIPMTRDWIAGVLDAVEAKAWEHSSAIDAHSERLTWLSVTVAGRRLLKTIDHLNTSDPKTAEAITSDLAQMLKGLLEGSRFLADAEIGVSAPTIQAAKAREAREDKRNKDPQVQAFHRAFDDALGGKTPEKIAAREFVGSIRKTINNALTDAGFKAVSDDAVRRRLKKLRS